MASLLGLYDEDYKSWSLGKLTMLKEIEFGIKTEENGYPGYVLDLDNFDYKLELGPMSTILQQDDGLIMKNLTQELQTRTTSELKLSYQIFSAKKAET